MRLRARQPCPAAGDPPLRDGVSVAAMPGSRDRPLEPLRYGVTVAALPVAQECSGSPVEDFWVEATLLHPSQCTFPETGSTQGVRSDPIVTGEQRFQGQPYDGNTHEGLDTKSIKESTFLLNMGNSLMPSSSAGRSPVVGGIDKFNPQTNKSALQEYQFFPEKPGL